jgi:hypothetical protein
MAYLFDDFQKFGKEHLEAMTKSSSLVTKGWQTIAAESSDFSKKSLDNSAVYLEQLLGAKTFENSLQVQSEYAKTFFLGLLEFLKKTGEVYSGLFKEAFSPTESTLTKVQACKE